MTEDFGAGWHRLHPLSPLIQGGGLLSGLLGIFALSLVTAEGYEAYVYQLVAAGAIMVAGLVRWLVTRWKLDGATLRIETGLLRRDSRQLPMARIQAVDVVRPLLARVLGLASLQIRLAGAGKGTIGWPTCPSVRPPGCGPYSWPGTTVLTRPPRNLPSAR